MKEIELINKRKLREKHFLREDGTFVAKVYNEDIHYLKNGKYEDIDNTLVKENDCYCNRSNDYKVRFKNNSNASLMRMEKDENYLDIKLKESHISNLLRKNKKSKLIEDILYKEILDDIDIEYKTLPTKVKETIILKSNNCRKLIFIINTNLKLEQKNSYILAKKDEKVIFTIDPPFMEDSNGNVNNNVQYNLNKINSCYELELILDSDWLNSSNVKYPVYIDPTITNTNQSSGLYDTYIYPGDTNVDRNSLSILKAGVERVNGNDLVNRTLIKFDLPEIGTGSEVIDARISFVGYLGLKDPGPESTSSEDRALVSVHRITQAWDENNANWQNMNDKFDSRIDAIMECYRSSLGTGDTIIPSLMDADITRLVKRWYKDLPNNGVMIKSMPETYKNNNFPAFFSKNNGVTGDPKPWFTITYRNQNGIEEYWNYISQDFTNGKTSINTYNGNVVGIFKIGYTLGGQQPVNLNLIYNTNDVVLNKVSAFGKGFRLSLNQTVRAVNIDNEEYLEYIDEDGTVHYFYREVSDVTGEYTGVYKDEDGLNLTLEKNDTQCTIKDKTSNELVFYKYNETYYLKEIKDTDGNTITIELNSNNEIIKVIDKNNCEILISYDDANQITITNSDNTTTKLKYVNGYLDCLENIYGNIQFSYNSFDLISSIMDLTGIKTTYEYYSESPYKVKEIKEYGTNNSIGRQITFEYGFNSTTMKDNNNNKCETLIFNNHGNLLSKNTLDEAEDINSAYSITTEFGNEYQNSNKVLSKSIPVSYIKNYLNNSSFESNIDIFDNNDKVLRTFSQEYYNSGKQSLKVECLQANQTIEKRIDVPKGNYYTFSGYFKSAKKCIVMLSYSDADGNEITSSEEVAQSNEFTRQDVTIYYDELATSNLKLSILFDSINTIYLDDIQLEVGEVANSYNIIENSDFSNGISDWTLEAFDSNNNQVSPNNFFETISLNNSAIKALKVKMNPLYVTRFSKEFPIKGKSGDLYTISFWYKNEGIAPCRQYAGNNVTIFYKPVDGEADYCIMPSSNFNENPDKWQYFTFRMRAMEDFESIRLIFNQHTQANNLYITNLSFYKEVTSGDYEYDDYGNVVKISDQSQESNTFKYDSKNQLVTTTLAKGTNYKYEYDKNKNDRVINVIEPNGIIKSMKYDDNGNLILSKTSSKYSSKLANTTYRIRNQGTDKYLKAKYRDLFLESNDCSNTIWNLIKIDNKYKIIYSVMPNYSLSYNNNELHLDLKDENNIFDLEENEDGSYCIRTFNNDLTLTRYLKATDTGITLETKLGTDSAYNFYFELVDNMFMEENATYSEDGRFISSISDSNNNTTNYNFDTNTGLLLSLTNAKGITTTNAYNNKKQIISTSCGDRSIQYSYNNKNLISQIKQGNKEYNFEYDEFLNNSKICIGDEITLINNEYKPNNGNLSKITYGNSDEISYEYDNFDRVKVLHKMDDYYYYKYNSNGNVAKIISNNYIEKNIYDVADRLCEYKFNNFKINYTYDNNNNVINKKYQVNNISHTLDNEIDQKNNISKITLDDKAINYEYDELNRISSRNYNNDYKVDYKYISNGKRTTGLIESIKNGDNKYSYKYDSLNNVTHIYLNNELNKEFAYDNYNELIQEIDYLKNVKTIYNYDTNGNILSKILKDISSDEIIENHVYQYENSNWEDQLTSFDNENILYDEIGNITSIGNNIVMTWTNGRNLNSYNNITKNMNISYKYNDENIRVSKLVNGIETKYFVEDKDIIYEQRGQDLIYYLYDLTGIIGLEYNGNKYYYVKNLQGDIVGILNSNYEQIVFYEYDSWGKNVGIKDSNGNEITDSTNIGLINPFRYRSYYYDSETELYYLNNRYYNPIWGRFINADGIIGSNDDFLGYNLYAYVSNNPISFYDSDGQLAIAIGIAGAIVGAIAGAIITTTVVKSITSTILAMANDVINSANALLNSLRNRTTTTTKKKSNKSSDTIIYRKGNYNYYQLTPRPVDLNGLSFTSIKPQQKNYMVTTVEAINSTKVLKVVRDVKDPNHYLVVPTASLTLVDWIRSKPTANENPHPYTKILASVVWDSRGRSIGGEKANE